MQEKDLALLINRFYREMVKEESYDLPEIACLLVPALVDKIEVLEAKLRLKEVMRNV